MKNQWQGVQSEMLILWLHRNSAGPARVRGAIPVASQPGNVAHPGETGLRPQPGICWRGSGVGRGSWVPPAHLPVRWRVASWRARAGVCLSGSKKRPRPTVPRITVTKNVESARADQTSARRKNGRVKCVRRGTMCCLSGRGNGPDVFPVPALLPSQARPCQRAPYMA